MKYILIIGASRSGKSTTINAVCKKLKADKVWQLNSESQFTEVDKTTEIKNGTYIIEVSGKIILVVAGSPTEQEITITIIIKVALKFKATIDFAIVTMRSFEKREGYDTPNELKLLGEKIYQEKIYRIEAELENNPIWNKRVNNIIEIINSNI